jgi:hypothetical protein
VVLVYRAREAGLDDLAGEGNGVSGLEVEPTRDGRYDTLWDVGPTICGVGSAIDCNRFRAKIGF